ncbi:MAG: hypothetical protein K0R80_889 [Clostridia bacterium]|nr:hypothetical protein [Clostridia bacterium]
MNNNYDKSLYLVIAVIITLGILVSAVGLFSTTGGQPYEIVNQFGDTVKIYGDGLYAYDSHFYAPIFKGADFTILFVAVPCLIAALMHDVKKKTLKSRLFLLSIISIFTYHAASIAFCVVYNTLHLAYIIFFSASLFGFIIALGSIDKNQLIKCRKIPFSYKGVYIFLAFTGVALIAAWLPDIIASISTGRPPVSLEIYTTSVTNVLDIGIIGPVSLLTIYLMKKENGMGFALAPMLLTLCVYTGIMIVSQTVFQISAGIELPLPVLITKAASFVILAIFAVYFDIKFFKSIENEQERYKKDRDVNVKL